MNVRAVPIPASTLTWEQEEILRLRDEVYSLKLQLRQARAAVAAPTPVNLPAEWKLSRPQRLIVSILYEAQGVVSSFALDRAVRQMGDPDQRPNAGWIQAFRTRKALKPFGIEIINHRGLGYELTPASREIVRKALESSASVHEPTA